VCGRNILDVGRDGIIVNDIVKASALGGNGNCALGINFNEFDTSDWQLSKLYIWNYHLPDVDFALASTLIHATLLTNTETEICQACPSGKHSDHGSVSMTDCKCEPGHSEDGSNDCIACEKGKYKA